MEERSIFDRFHEALDVEPPTGAYDRMRFALTSSPVVLRQRPVSRLRFTKMGFRVAAALIAAAIVVVAVVAYVSLHHPTASVVPGNQGPDIRPYQALIARDYATTFVSETGHCNAIGDTACAAAVDRVSSNLQAWLDDLKNFNTPARFTQVDAMLRGHLAQAVAAGTLAKAAQKAGNATLFDAAIAVHLGIRAFIVDLAKAVADTRVASAQTYVSAVQDQAALLSSCSPCAGYLATPPVTCTKPQPVTCVADAFAVEAQVHGFELAVVQQAAPTTLAAKDANLQKDLVNADSALVTAINDGLAGDGAGFNSANASVQISLAAVTTDLAAIRNG